jgi:4,5-dihydroxyphthalate decarboxylase
MDAFTKAKAPYLANLKAGKGDTADDKKYRSFLPLMDDPLPYGVSANKASTEALITYALQQKLIPSRPSFSDVFVEIDP